MKKTEFEYTMRTEGSHIIEGRRIAFLNEVGKEGWELVDVVQNLFTDDTPGVATFDFYFKRKVSKKETK